MNEYAKYICEYQDKSDLFKARFGKLCCFTMPCSLVTRFFFIYLNMSLLYHLYLTLYLAKINKI